jgi:hypothetical protein
VLCICQCTSPTFRLPRVLRPALPDFAPMKGCAGRAAAALANTIGRAPGWSGGEGPCMKRTIRECSCPITVVTDETLSGIRMAKRTPEGTRHLINHGRILGDRLAPPSASGQKSLYHPSVVGAAPWADVRIQQSTVSVMNGDQTNRVRWINVPGCLASADAAPNETVFCFAFW